MNCCKCGEEIREPAGYLCEKCLEDGNGNRKNTPDDIYNVICQNCEKEFKPWEKGVRTCASCGDAICPECSQKLGNDCRCKSCRAGQEKEDIIGPIESKEAIIAILKGERIVTDFGYPVAFDNETGRFHYIPDYSICDRFRGLFRISEKKRQPMGAFEIMAWVNSPESQGWMVRRKYIGNDYWEDWDIPQRFRYDTQEEFGDPDVVEYQRARVLPDKSGVDESTIQGFLKELA